ncbi:MAG: MmgE/PrpD family protein, partial [Rhodobacteraceae bacterium]|nr:MmgE/PrpD family protein [Paracoccaceae bacterium]
LGLVGATAAAAWLMRCTEDQTAQAIGLAGAAAGGGKSVFGTNAKSFLVGETAQRAIQFARFAKAGLSGPATSFHGENGFFHLLNNDVEQQDAIETLGVQWRLDTPGLLVKRYPVCSAAHVAIDEVARHTFESDLSPDDIEAIHLDVPKLVRISLMHDAPTTPSEAQFSLPFAAACAALHGSVRLGDLNCKTLQAPAIKRLMQKVQISVDDDLSTEEMRERFPESARVRVVLKNGEQRTGFCGEAYGMPGRPLNDIDFIQKFRECLTFARCLADVKNIFDESVLNLAADLFGAHQTTKNQQRRLS